MDCCKAIPVLHNSQEHHRAALEEVGSRDVLVRTMVGIMIITGRTSAIQSVPLHGTSPAAPGSPIQERCEYTGSSVKDHKDGEGPRVCFLQGKAEKARTVQPGEEKAQNIQPSLPAKWASCLEQIHLYRNNPRRDQT